MLSKTDKTLIERGIKVADYGMHQEDRIWSRYSRDKVDIGERLAAVIRTLAKSFALGRRLKALSIGSSAEPQFRLLETTFRGGLYLLDVDRNALAVVQERIKRQCADHVSTIHGNYNKFFLTDKNAGSFLHHKLRNNKMDLITLHHSLYYCPREGWLNIFENLYRKIMAAKGAVHAVLMTAETKDPCSTTWLYNHFAGKYFGHHNNQDLLKFTRQLKKSPLYGSSQLLTRTSRIHFWVADFEKFMAVIWMILLYPNVHPYTVRQREEITEYIYKKFWRKKKPLIQLQDHLVVYRGLGFKGLL